MTNTYYTLEEWQITHSEKSEFPIASAALVTCDLCCRPINGAGGVPGCASVCSYCGEALTQGKLRGVVEWEDQPGWALVGGRNEMPEGDEFTYCYVMLPRMNSSLDLFDE